MKDITREEFGKLTNYEKVKALENQNLTWFNRSDFRKLGNRLREYTLRHQNLTWFERNDFEKLHNIRKWHALQNQNLTWFERNDFEKLHKIQKWHALQYQNLNWITRDDFEKLNNIQKCNTLRYQNLNWFGRGDFERLSGNHQERVALQYQNLTWFGRGDFEWLDSLQKEHVLQYQNLSWFTKEILGDYYKHHKKRTKEECLAEMEEYAKKYGLKFDGENLFAFRTHDRVGRGLYSRTIFYEVGKYYKDWHLDADETTQNSFGLGIFSKGNTPVKVHIDDWGCRIPTTDKCRVWAFTGI